MPQAKSSKKSSLPPDPVTPGNVASPSVPASPTTATIHFDGGCLNANPGNAAGAAVLTLPDGSKVMASRYLEYASNNEAEYTGLIEGLKKAQELGIHEVNVFGDSQLVVYQFSGQYRCKVARLRLLLNQARALARKFKLCRVSWVRREFNSEADAAATDCLNAALNIKPIVGNSEQFAPPPPALDIKSKVESLNKSGSGGSFKEFLALKVPGGRDNFSSMKLDKLKAQAGADVVGAIEGAVGGDEELLKKALRWYLRGLAPAVAVRKVQVDCEVSANASRCASTK